MQVFTPVVFDENGAVSNAYYYTDTYQDGTVASNTHCSDWTSNAAVFVGVGAGFATTGIWDYTGDYCSRTSEHLLCFQTGAGPALPAYTTTGKQAFITSTSGSGNLSAWTGAGANTGVAAGDAVCQSLAAAKGLTNAAGFKAWLSTSTTDAKTRFTSNGPWVRLDGVKVAASLADLTDGTLFTTINLTETGQYLTAYGVWTGTVGAGLKDTQTCGDWTNGTTGALGMVGMACFGNSMWTQYTNTWTCEGTNYHMYCLED